MSKDATTPSARQTELLEAAYEYVLTHGIADLSLRPLAAAIGSSTRVLMFLFENKDGLTRALLDRARVDEIDLLEQLHTSATPPIGIASAVEHLWDWLAAERIRPLLRLWAEAYTRSFVEPNGPWEGFASSTVTDWLDVLASCQASPGSQAAMVERTLALVTLRGSLLVLLATGERAPLDDSIHTFCEMLRN